VRRTLTWLALVLVGACCAGASLAADSHVTTVFLVRHAEKNAHEPGGDAGLSAKGILRSQELARVLADTPLAAIYASHFPRARLTAESVARAQRDSVRIYDPNQLEALAERIRAEHAGQTVLVIGHGDTLPGTFEALTGDAFPDKDVPYDKLYVVTLSPGGGYRLLTLHYGARVQ
jgi:broad specificity phosphatase PhoE